MQPNVLLPGGGLTRRCRGTKRLAIGIPLLLALGVTGCASEVKNIRFEGRDITGAGLSVRADQAKSTILISSSSRRFSVRLPYAEDWNIESNDDAALFAESPRLRLQAFLSDGDSGPAGFEEEVALLLHLYLSSKAFGTKAKPQAIQKEGGLLVLEATYKAGGELKEGIYLAATARQAPWQPKREYRTLALTLKSPEGGPLTPAQVKELARQDFRQSAGP